MYQPIIYIFRGKRNDVNEWNGILISPASPS